MTIAELTASWRQQADDMDRTAKAYRRGCVEAKAVQLILLAKQLRACADAADEVAGATLAQVVQDR